MANTYCILMAGGVGSRFWPVSTEILPKQFHDLLGTGESLIQQTYRRLRLLTDADKILVVTHRNYVALTKEHLPDLKEENILAEPSRRNTAPCITYASYRILSEDPQANILIAPSDHLISNEKEFERVAQLALTAAEKWSFLITLGIKPHRPDTGYGYIQYEAHGHKKMPDEIKAVKTFTEKPNEEIAREFIQSGDFLWNSGIFVWNLQTYLKELKEHQPELYQTFDKGRDNFGTAKEDSFLNKVYPSCENISIDYGLMEKANQVLVIPADFGWSDLGTWGSLYEHSEKDENGNAVQGDRLLTYESSNNVIQVPRGKATVISNLDNHIVIDTGKSLLICRKDQEQLIKTFVSDLKLRFGEAN